MVLDTYIKNSDIYKFNAQNKPNAAFRRAENDKIITYGKKFNLFNIIKSYFISKKPTPDRWLEVGE